MRFNFKKIAAIGTSVLLTGMSMGFAAAANYPLPFVSGGVANVGIVYGTGTDVSPLDAEYAQDVSDNLALSVSGGGVVTTSGEVVSLDTSQDRIWLNTSLTAVKATLTESDLPTVLADYSFSGDVTSQVTHTIKLVAGAAAGGANSGKVIFAKQPTSSDDPVIGLSMGTGVNSQPLYNASATMSAINFTHADSEGEEIELFGQSFTIASATDTTKIVMLKEAEKIDLTLPGNPTSSVTIDGSAYTVTLVTASDTAATITITDSSGESQTKEVSEAASKRINGVDVAVTRASSSSLESVGESASVIVGSQKVTLQSGSTVTLGEDDDPIDGTFVYIVGGTGATTEIAIAVFRADSETDAILPGDSFEDPVYGSFKMNFAGLSSPVDDAERDVISVDVSGDDTMTVSFTEEGGDSDVFDFAHNESSNFHLGDNANYSISVVEGQNLSYGNSATDKSYVVVGNENYGHLLELNYVNNNTGSDYNDDDIRFTDVMTGDTYSRSAGGVSFTAEGTGTLDVDGKRYTLTFIGTGEDAMVNVKYPTSDAASTELVLFPTIQTAGGSLVTLYEPVEVRLDAIGLATTDVTKIWFPDGDGYTGFTVSFPASGQSNWSINSYLINTTSATNFTVLTVGEFTYNVTGSGSANVTKIFLIDPETAANNIDQPGLLIYEPKDDNSEYHGVVVDLETNPGGTSDNGVGINDVLFSSTENYHDSATLASDSDITKDMDWVGTLTTIDATDSDQKTLEISIPTAQVYAQLYVAATDAVIAGEAGAIGDVIYKDTEVSQASTKNLIIVGGSCINSAAATLVGGAKCGADWTAATGAGSGEFLIQSFGDSAQDLTSGIALLVAGYEVSDTLAAVTYLTNEKPSTTAGTKLKGTTSTSTVVSVA